MPRVFIIANGESDFPISLPTIVNKNDIVICADGGSNHAIAFGIKPTIVVGDMDSISSETLVDFEKQGVDLRRFPRDKDASDLELALTAAVEFNPTEITCLCVLGNRQDHAMTNTFLLGRFAELGSKVTILGATWHAQFITKKHPREFSGTAGDILSLIPMVAIVSGVTVKGVKWPLSNSTLEWGSSQTVSNEFVDQRVSITVEQGLVLAFHYRNPSP